MSDSKGNDKMLFSAANNIQLVTIPLPFFIFLLAIVKLFYISYNMSYLFYFL